MKRISRLIFDEHDERHFGAVSHPIYQNSLFTCKTSEELEHALTFQQDHYLYMRGKNQPELFLQHGGMMAPSTAA